MDHRFAPLGQSARAKRTLLLVAFIALLDAAPSPRCAVGASGPDFAALLPEFNRICSDLARAREELRSGRLDNDAFADRVLDLFVRADSLHLSMDSAGATARRFGGPLFAMDRGLRYLIESLRENYVGIAARNGVNFIAADRALQAAVAWRSGAGSGGVSENLGATHRPQ
jgi:hypothetical protein